jgi:hypothetical protein
MCFFHAFVTCQFERQQLSCLYPVLRHLYSQKHAGKLHKRINTSCPPLPPTAAQSKAKSTLA